MLSYDLSRRDCLSLYEYLYRCIRDDIVAGSLDPDDRLPSKRSLAEHLGVSLITIEGAYSQLIAEGYVHTKPRRGYYVSRLPRQLPKRAQHRKGRAAVSYDTLPNTDRHPDLIADFSRPSLQPTSSTARLWSKALRTALVQEDQLELFAAQPRRGSIRLRRAVAGYLNSSHGMDVDPERIVIGAGAQLLYSMISLLIGRDTTVAIEDPGYPRLHETYQVNGLNTVPLSIDDEGISMAELNSSPASLVHIMPSHQFPTGRVTSIARRYELLGWASHAKDRYLIEDDYDWEFRFAGKPIPSLQSIDAEGKVIYLSTFSKSLSSALRIAFAVLPAQLSSEHDEKLGFFSSTVSIVDQTVLARLIESGQYERHLNRYRKQSRSIRDCLVDALQSSEYGELISIEEKDSGLHFVLAIETNRSESDIAQRAWERDVKLAPLSSYAIRPDCSIQRDGKARFVMQYDGLSLDRVEEVRDILGYAIGSLQS